MSRAALAGGALYGFSPYVIAHALGHLHSVASAVTAPLLLLLFDELFVRQRMRPRVLALCLAMVLVFQFFIHEENFVTEIMAAAMLAFLLAAMFRSQVRERAPYVKKALLMTIALVAVLLAYPLYVELFGPERRLGAILNPDVYATDALNLVVPDTLQLIAPSAASRLSGQFTGNASEWNGYLGIPLLLITTFTTARYWKVPVVRIAAVMAAGITLLSLGPHLHIAGQVTPVPLPWWIPARIPLIRDVIPSRLMVYVYLAVAIILAFALNRLAASRRGRSLAAAVAAAALVPLMPAFPLAASPVSAPSFFTSASASVIPQGTVVLTIPWAAPDTVEQMDPMVWAAETHMGFRILGGYYLSEPSPNQGPLHSFADELAGLQSPAALPAAEQSRILSLLKANHVGAVLLYAARSRQASRDMVTSLLGTRPRDLGGVDIWFLRVATPR